MLSFWERKDIKENVIFKYENDLMHSDKIGIIQKKTNTLKKNIKLFFRGKITREIRPNKNS